MISGLVAPTGRLPLTWLALVLTVLSASVLLGGGVKEVKAGAREVTNFTEIDGASFIDLPGSDSLAPITFGSVLITADQPLATGSFASFATGGSDDPADGSGYFATTTGIGARLISSITLDFSLPLAAFGVTFHHFPPERNTGNDFPALLQVFDGPSGSGNLLGSISSSGLLTSDPGGNPDFVAVWTDTLNIRSAILTGTGPSRGFAVDGYAVSFTPMFPVIEVDIDIMPGEEPNPVNPRNRGVIPVAILTTATFDATTVNTSTVRFGKTGTEAAIVRSALEDVDGDGDTDLLLFFNIPDTGIACGQDSAVLTGVTEDGQEIEGSDSIRTVGCQ
jgi:hypothetical protein